MQYLEQLRQVIGLRQYGQKDPLSEFKKEAFVLFEGLLLKIKNDLIKFLLNLNIVVSNEEQKKEGKRRMKYLQKKNLKKKLVEMKNALVDQVKNLNIVMEISNFKFF